MVSNVSLVHYLPFAALPFAISENAVKSDVSAKEQVIAESKKTSHKRSDSFRYDVYYVYHPHNAYKTKPQYTQGQKVDMVVW